MTTLQIHSFKTVGNDLWSAAGTDGTAPDQLSRIIGNKEHFYIEDVDFASFDADDDWVVTNATAGTAEVIDGAGGILQLDSASTTADQGVQIQRKVETFTPAASNDIWFECRLKITDTIDKCQVFAGLSILDTTIFASGEVTATDYIGWVLDATQQAATASTIQLQLNSTAGSEEKTTSGEKLFVEDTYTRLGFHLLSNTTLQAYVDGVAVGSALTISDCPTTDLSVSFACLSEGTNDPICSLDWYRCIQRR